MVVELAQQLTTSGHYTAILVSAEVGAPFPHDPGAAEAAMLGSWRDRAKTIYRLSYGRHPGLTPLQVNGCKQH